MIRTNSNYSITHDRYLYQGQEMDGEVKGEGNSYTTEFRQYDPRIGRWLTLDPEVSNYPAYSPYMAMMDNPIIYNDPQGDDPIGKQHKVQKGDTYWKIAQNSKGKISVDDLKKWNAGVDPSKLKIGSFINVSDPSEGYSLGANGKVGAGEDSKSETNGTPSTEKGINEVNHYIVSKTNIEKESRNDFKTVNMLAAGAGTQSAVGKDQMKAVNRFLTGLGGVYTDYLNAENAVIMSLVYKELSRTINLNFENAYKNAEGDISKMKMVIPTPPNLGGISKQMLALFGGTQYIEIFVTDFERCGDGSYSGTLQVEIYDDYGVSIGDVTKKYSYAANLAGAPKGLVGMWVLQHQYGYKPMI